MGHCLHRTGTQILLTHTHGSVDNHAYERTTMPMQYSLKDFGSLSMWSGFIMVAHYLSMACQYK